MNPQEPKSISENRSKEMGRPHLRMVYRIMIRSYLRHQMRQIQPSSKEAEHG